jgi:hypothetical protein
LGAKHLQIPQNVVLFILMRTLAETIIQGRLDRQFNELETSLRLSGKILESLPLGLGDTTIDREVLPDGVRGQVRISTQEGQSSNRYLLKDGQIVTDSAYGDNERQVKYFQKIKILARIAFGKVDHWDRESDFYGTFDEG